MSSSIWTRCGGSSSLAPLALRPWRSVESQHLISTRKLVDSDEEQRLLEELLEERKPPATAEEERLHYLLYTPFRYPPRHGSRFGTRRERGIWYGAETPRAVFAEVAYYRLHFLEGSEAGLEPLMVELTLFRAVVRTEAGVDLTAPPFDVHRGRIASPVSYRSSQALGRAMRGAGVEAFRYPSARDRQGGVNVGVFNPVAFATRRPRSRTFQTWLCVATRERVEISAKGFVRRPTHEFERRELEVDGRLPEPAW